MKNVSESFNLSETPDESNGDLGEARITESCSIPSKIESALKSKNVQIQDEGELNEHVNHLLDDQATTETGNSPLERTEENEKEISKSENAKEQHTQCQSTSVLKPVQEEFEETIDAPQTVEDNIER